MIEPLAGDLSGYFYFFGVKGAMLQQLGRTEEARVAFDRAIALANNAAEAAHIRLQLDRLQQGQRAGCKKNLRGLSEPRGSIRPRDRELKTRTDHVNATPNPGHELVLTRLIDAPRENLFRCWTEPELMKKWFAPLPWTVTHAEIDLRPAAAA